MSVMCGSVSEAWEQKQNPFCSRTSQQAKTARQRPAQARPPQPQPASALPGTRKMLTLPGEPPVRADTGLPGGQVWEQAGTSTEPPTPPSSPPHGHPRLALGRF